MKSFKEQSDFLLIITLAIRVICGKIGQMERTDF